MNDYYVYVHKRATTGEPFYYGRGKDKRAWDPARNKWYGFVAAKHGRIVEILLTGLTEDESRVEEIRHIAEARQRGENITNQTVGGDGISGKAARAVGLRHKKNKTSIFAPGVAAKGGRIAAQICKDKGVGVIAMTVEEHREIGLKAVVNKTGIHHPDFDKRAASLLGCNMPWWLDKVTGKPTRAWHQPSPNHEPSIVPVARMPWWVNDETGETKRSFEPIIGFRKGRKVKHKEHGND